MFGVIKILRPKCCKPNQMQVRYFWEYINMMFNKPDPQRIKEVGPDRACAEWILRNGGIVVWTDGTKLNNYNLLPPNEQSVPKLIEIDASNSSISHYGFPHLSGCKMLRKIILHECSYIDDRALKDLSHGRSTLTHLQVSKCGDVTDTGVKDIKVLDKLEELNLFELTSVENLDKCIKYLQTHLPECKITGALGVKDDD